MKKLLMCGMAAVCLFAQNNAPEVAISGGPAARGWTNLYFYTTISGADYVEYICSAPTQRNLETLSVTQIVDSSNTATVTTSAAHGLAVGNRVQIAGVTGDTDLNGTYVIATVGSTTTFTYTSASVTDATYNNAGITLQTTAPRSTQPIWAITKFSYGGAATTNQVIREQWAVKAGSEISSPSNPSTQHVCDDRAALAYQ